MSNPAPLLLVVLLAAVPRLPAADATALFPDEILARGRGFTITSAQLDQAFVGFKANAAIRGESVPEALRDDVQRRILDKLITTEVLKSRATAEDRAKGRAAAEKVLALVRQRAPSEEAFNRQLKAVGITAEEFQKQVVDQAVCEEVIEREVRAGITVSAAQVRKFYDDNPARFEQPEMARVRHVLLSDRDAETGQPLPPDQLRARRTLAESIRDRARKGDDFSALVKEFSEDKASKERDGEYTFPRGQMVPEFEAASFSLGVGQVSDVVETRYGFHVIKLVEKIPPQRAEFAKVEERIRQGLVLQEVARLTPAYFERIRKEAEVEILAPWARPQTGR
jgi:peptidyl-prolyl cis-trans isomerase C